MGTDLDVVIMLAALLTMLAGLVRWDGWPPAEEPPAEHAVPHAKDRSRR